MERKRESAKRYSGSFSVLLLPVLLFLSFFPFVFFVLFVVNYLNAIF